MKPSPHQSPPQSPAQTPTPAVRTPWGVRLGAIMALLAFGILVTVVFFGPKGDQHSGAASRPTGGSKVETPATPASSKN